MNGLVAPTAQAHILHTHTHTHTCMHNAGVEEGGDTGCCSFWGRGVTGMSWMSDSTLFGRFPRLLQSLQQQQGQGLRTPTRTPTRKHHGKSFSKARSNATATSFCPGQRMTHTRTNTRNSMARACGLVQVCNRVCHLACTHAATHSRSEHPWLSGLNAAPSRSSRVSTGFRA
jgi:hypothetical protein